MHHGEVIKLLAKSHLPSAALNVFKVSGQFRNSIFWWAI